MQLFPELDALTLAVLFDGPVPDCDEAAWDAFRNRADVAKLAPLANRWIREHAVAAPEAVVDSLRVAARWSVAITMQLMEGAAASQASLERAGIPSLVVKGPSVARWYPMPQLRCFGDIDLLVDPADFNAAVQVLLHDGFAYQEDPNLAARPFFLRSCWEGVNLVDGAGSAVDVHHHIAPWWFGRKIRFADLMCRSRVESTSGITLRVADATTDAVVVALHLLGTRPPGEHLLGWRDLCEVLRQCDTDDLLETCRAWGVAGGVATVLSAAPVDFGGALMRAVGSIVPTREERYRIGQLTASRTRTGAWERTFSLPAPRAALYVVGQLFPSRSSIRARFGDAADYRDLYRIALFNRTRPGSAPGSGPCSSRGNKVGDDAKYPAANLRP